MGLVSSAFPPEALLKLRYGNLGICHTRYSTTGISELQNCQPFVVDTLHGKIAVAHNGELVNAHALRKKVRMAPWLVPTEPGAYQWPSLVLCWINRHKKAGLYLQYAICVYSVGQCYACVCVIILFYVCYNVLCR